MLNAPFTTMMMLRFCCTFNWRALLLGTNLCAATMALIFSLASRETSGWSFSARETVDTAYPDSLAMSLIVNSCIPLFLKAATVIGNAPGNVSSSFCCLSYTYA